MHQSTISGRGFARMEQSAVQRHLVVTDCGVSNHFLVLFCFGLCLTILLCFPRSVYRARLRTGPFY